MRNIRVILAREFKAYFTRPLGYIYLISLVLFTNLLGLFLLQPFFDYPLADMRRYFHFFAGVSAFLVAAITMRLWAEEREQNTHEMLLTLPMRAHELVLGKFLAALFFYAVGLACTLTVPLMMVILARTGTGGLGTSRAFGLLDPWTAACGYGAALLLGGLFIAFGQFVSGLCRDQIVAFVVTAPLLFLAYILGLAVVQDGLNTALAFVAKDAGTAIGEFVGIFWHYDYLVRGLVRGGDVLFFLIWIVVFLVLNVLAVERRHRPHNVPMYTASLILMCAIGVTGNWICHDQSLGYVDMTEGRIFTIDKVSVDVLKRLREPVRVRYVVSPRASLPARFQGLERDVQDKLDALRVASDGMIRYRIIHPEAPTGLKTKEEKDASGEGVQRKIVRKVQPFSIAVRERGRDTAQWLYSGIEVAYLGKETEALNQIVTDETMMSGGAVPVSQLEYALIRLINRLTRERAPIVAMVAPKQEISPRMLALYEQMKQPVPPPYDPYETLQYYLQHKEDYDVRRVRLTKGSPLPRKYDVLVILEPGPLDDRQLWEINRALVNGKPVFLAVQNQVFRFAWLRNGIKADHEAIKHGLNRVLGASGIRIDDRVIMVEKDAAPVIGVPVRMPFGGQAMQQVQVSIHQEIAAAGMLAGHPCFDRVSRLRVIWGSPLQVDKVDLANAKIKQTTLLQTPPRSWLRALGPGPLDDTDVHIPSDSSKLGAQIVGALFEGPFVDAFANQPIPEWADDPRAPPVSHQEPVSDSEPGEIHPQPGRLLLVGDAMFLNRAFLARMDELNFFLNSVGLLALSDTDQRIRALETKASPQRVIGDITPFEVRLWTGIQLGGHACVLTAVGLALWLLRRRRREAAAAASR